MGKQINFFLHPEDWEKINAYLPKAGWEVLWIDTDKNISKLPAIPQNQPEKRLYLIQKGNTDKPGKAVMPGIQAIEVDTGAWDSVSGQAFRGRFYYEEDQRGENNGRLPNDARFLQPADRLFKWFRRNFKRLPSGHYAGRALAEDAGKGAAVLAYQ